MNKPVDKLYDAITDVDESLIEKSENAFSTTKKKNFFYRYKHLFEKDFVIYLVEIYICVILECK